MIVRTMRDVFPHLRLIRVSNNNTILLGANEPLDRDAAVARRSQELVDSSKAIQFDLQRFFDTTNVAALLLTHMCLDESGLQRLVENIKSGDKNSDGNLQLEFRAARHLYSQHGENVGRTILKAAAAEWFIEQYNRLGCDESHSERLHQLAILFLNSGSEGTAVRLVEFGLQMNRNSTALLADRLIGDNHLNQLLLDRLMALADTSVAVAANRVGVAFWEKKQFANAVTVFERLALRFPNSATTWANLAVNYRAVGSSESTSALRKALELDPLNEFAVRESTARMEMDPASLFPNGAERNGAAGRCNQSKINYR